MQGFERRRQSFRLLSLVIDKRCDKSICKNLRPDTYSFGQIETENFFGENISVTAIVGKNGSGKSTLLEILFRMINNFSFYVHGFQKRKSADNLFYVDGLYASLNYVHGKQLCSLKFENKKMFFEAGSRKIGWRLTPEERKAGDYETLNCKNIDQVKETSSLLFYTIVTNYSMQSFNSQDYENDIELYYRQRRPSLRKYLRPKGVNVWINSLFHKNDGYMSPIVINPYRDRGHLDMYKEYRLTLSRIASILLEIEAHNKNCPNNKYQFVDGYNLHHIRFNFDEQAIQEKYRCYTNVCKGKFEKLTELFDSAYHNNGTYVKIILDELVEIGTLKKYINEVEDKMYKFCAMYLVQKIMYIGSRYPAYSELVDLNEDPRFGGFSVFSVVEQENVNGIRELVKSITKDTSHITTKFWQTIRLMRFIAVKESPEGKDITPPCVANLLSPKGFLFSEFSSEIDTYVRMISVSNPDTNNLTMLERRINSMPPSFFAMNIYLQRQADDEIVNFVHLSSGERQLVFLLSTLLYHLINIASVKKERVRYNAVSLILDEIELCFHPDYQRLFLNTLLESIERFDLNKTLPMHIILTTHSPFILSDIPNECILYLKDGEKHKSEKKQTFGANILELLHQSFFMKDGFTGEFARQKINRLVSQLKGGTVDEPMSNPEIENIIDLVGDDLVRQQLYYLYDNYLHKANSTGRAERIAKLRAELEILENGFGYETDSDN